MYTSDIWKAYYERTQNRPPREVLVQGLSLFSEPAQAIDLGCGAGRDTLGLLRTGWHVLAIDAEAEAISVLRRQVPPEQQTRLTTQVSRFEALDSLPTAMLINSSFALPFCPPAAFGALWQTICEALLPNGRFVGNFFGLDDDWADRPHHTHHPEAEVRALFSQFEIEYWHEENEMGATANGQSKHWHVYTVIGKKM